MTYLDVHNSCTSVAYQATASLHDRTTHISMPMVQCITMVRASRRARKHSSGRSRGRSGSRRLRDVLVSRLDNDHANQHLKILTSSGIAEENAHGQLHGRGELASQIRHHDARHCQSVNVGSLHWVKNAPDGLDDFRQRVASSGVGSALLNGHVLEQVGRCNQGRGEGA